MDRRGRAHVLPDDVDTDQIIPGEYLTTVDEANYGEHALEGYDETYPDRIEQGDILVAGENFGLGSSREAAPISLKNAGVGAIVAESFARIFYRNCVNVGLPLAEVPGITAAVQAGDEIRVDTTEGVVENLTTGESFSAGSLPPRLEAILEAGGLIAYRKQSRD